MKMTKRIFIALLIVSVMVSAFAFTATASSGSALDYSYLLEYYEEPTLFYYDFTGEDVDYSSSLLVNRSSTLTSSVVADETAPGGKYLSLEIAAATNKFNTYSDNHVYFNWTSENGIDDFIINMTVSGVKASGKEQNLPKIIVAVSDQGYTDPSVGSSVGTTIAAIDYRNGYFSYLKKNVSAEGVVSATETNTSFAITEGTWYDIEIVYNHEQRVATVKVTDANNARNTYTVTDAYVPYEAVKNVRIGAHGTDNGVARGSIMKFAKIYALGGQYKRNPADMQADIESTLLKMHDVLSSDDVALEDKIATCGVANKLVEYGFTTTDAEVQRVLDALGVGVIGLYNDKIETCVRTYESLPTFAEKKALVDDAMGCVEMLEDMDLTEVDASLVATVNENIAAIKAVDEIIKAVEADSKSFIEAVELAMNVDLTDYTAINSSLEAINVYNPDSTYEGIEDAYAFYLKLTATAESIKSSADAFIAAVEVANDSTLDINTRADAYRLIADIYYDNETYPGITEAIATYTDSVVPYLSVEIERGDSFIKYVNKADYAIYVSAKQDNLDIAATYMDICHPEYRGVAEAKLLYAEVQTQVNNLINSANAYIEAVKALESLSGDALSSAIKIAQGLQEAGNVLGVPGVTEANIVFDQIVASIELRTGYSNYFIRVVDSIDTASSTEALYAILKEAKELEANADKSFAGVSEASVKLEKAIADYNKLVNETNAEFTKASDVAANTCGIGTSANTVADRVIALIKKFFDEE